MPYIDKNTRILMECQLGRFPQTPGELNYAVTKLLKIYMQSRGLSYQTINDVIGALEGAKIEFYRRVAAPYEDKKIEENGDVY